MSAVRITGQLRGPARMSVDASGAAWVMFSLEASGGAQALVRKRIGIGYAAQHIAMHNARALRSGTQCTVHAAGIERMCRAKLDALHAYPPGPQAPNDHMLLLGVDWIDAPQVALRQFADSNDNNDNDGAQAADRAAQPPHATTAPEPTQETHTP